MNWTSIKNCEQNKDESIGNFKNRLQENLKQYSQYLNSQNKGNIVFPFKMGSEENRTTADEMVGWHHQLNGHRFGWTPRVGDGQGGLVCYGSWGCKELDTTEWLNWNRHKIQESKKKLEREIISLKIYTLWLAFQTGDTYKYFRDTYRYFKQKICWKNQSFILAKDTYTVHD